MSSIYNYQDSAVVKHMLHQLKKNNKTIRLESHIGKTP